MSDFSKTASSLILTGNLPAGAPPIAILATALVDENAVPVLTARAGVIINGATSNLLTIAEGGAVVFAGAYTGTFTLTATTGVTFPTTGTLSTLAGSESLSNKTVVAPVISTGLTASGSASNNFGGSTGAFVTSSGAGTLSGTTTLAANKNLLCASGTTALDLSLGTGICKTPTGLHTLGGKVAFKVIASPVAASGSNGATSAAFGSGTMVVGSSDSSAKGWSLVTGVAGDLVIVMNSTSTAGVLYPATGGTLNGLSANAGVVIPASKGALCFCTAADTWTTFDLTAKSTAA